LGPRGFVLFSGLNGKVLAGQLAARLGPEIMNVMVAIDFKEGPLWDKGVINE
jgi:hypothetical protein